MSAWGARRGKPEPVGMGAYHTGIEVHGVEWTFAAESGIFNHPPKGAQGAVYRERIHLGNTAADSREVERIISRLRPEWPGSRYNIVKCNCNSFSDALANELLGFGIPLWVNRLSWWGKQLSCLLPESMFGSPSTGVPPNASAPQRNPSTSQSGSYSGSGQRLGSATTAAATTTTTQTATRSSDAAPLLSSDDLEEKRRRAAIAAAARRGV